MIYIRIGLFAEGPTDYSFFLGLIDRLVDEIAASVCKGDFQSAPALGIDAPRSMRDRNREERVAAAIEASWDECTVFVVHGDGAGDPEGVRKFQIKPGIMRARSAHSDLAVAACVPVRETEAWMLADAGAFSRLFGTFRTPPLPVNPESESDPKKTLRDTLTSMGVRGNAARYYADLGKEIQFTELRRLVAFRSFESDLRAAIAMVAGPHGSL